MAISYTVAGAPGLVLDAIGNGFDAKCPKCGTVAHLRMSSPYPDDNFVQVDKVSMTCAGTLHIEADPVKDIAGYDGPCDFSVKEGQLVGTM